jgi:hypothetical protein
MTPHEKGWATRRTKYGPLGHVLGANPGNSRQRWETRRQRYGDLGIKPDTEIPWDRIWKERRARYGPSGCSKAPAKMTCRNGHDLTIHGVTKIEQSRTVRRCRICIAEANARWCRKKHPEQVTSTLLIPGKSVKHLKTWAVRRERYGDKGLSPKGQASLISPRPYRKKNRLCRRRLHEMADDNVVIVHGGRRCAACLKQFGSNRPAWVEINSARISLVAHDKYYRQRYSSLRRVVLASHPDIGGTTRKFQTAQARFERFQKTETEWYKLTGWAPPHVSSRRCKPRRDTAA